MRMRAIKSWMNKDFEGLVQPDDEFEASEYRAKELIRIGLAIPCLSETEKVRVQADPASEPPQVKGRARKGAPLPKPRHAPPRLDSP